MNIVQTPIETTNASKVPDIQAMGQRAALGAERVIASSKVATNDLANSVQDGLDVLQDKLPSALSRAAARADRLARDGLERAREQGQAVRERALDMGDQTVRYVRDEPVKSLAIAAAVGALLGLIIGARSRGSDH